MDDKNLALFLDALGYDEEPFGMFYTDDKPEDGYAPQQAALPTREAEEKGEADLADTFRNWSCVLQHLWLARKKKSVAWFDREHFGCLGGAFFLGYNKPQLEAIVHYVSTGIPGHMEGEHYFGSPDKARKFYATIDPLPAPRRYCVFKPLSLFRRNETPLLVNLFARPEVISGLHQLAMFVTDDVDAVASPWGAGCSNLVSWPMRYLSEGKDKATLGGWDPSCRKFLKTDEITFTLPYPMFERMLLRWKDSFLTAPAWKTVQKKIARSKKTWGER